jgi:glycosyltransferase involved in cell wall biosynthesis
MYEFSKAKLSSLSLAKYVCFVDDDDLVINDSLRKTLEAIKAHDLGAVFTDEECITANGTIFNTTPLRQGLRYRDVLTNVKTIHHLAMFNGSMVSAGVADVIQRTRCYSATDWAIGACAAFVGGAAHLPIRGYQWRHHPSNMHRTESASFSKHLATVRGFLHTRLPTDGYILRLPQE